MAFGQKYNNFLFGQDSNYNYCKNLIDGVYGEPNNSDIALTNGVWTFDGTDDYIDFGDVMDFEITDTFSIEMWINPTTLGTIHSLFVKWNFPVGARTQIE